MPSPEAHTHHHTGELPTIGKPTPQLPGGVQRAVAVAPTSGRYSNYWDNGATITVRFMGGTDYVRSKVMQYAREWTQYANVDFRFVTSGSGDIRVSFVNNGSSWSMIGRQALYAPRNQATMNFGWFNRSTPEYDFKRTVLHEFGHALGLLHEHQNPTGGIPWDEAAVYDFYRRTQGWDRRTTYENVMKRRPANETQFSSYDAASIMHYPVSPQLTGGRYQVGMNNYLSNTDIAFIAELYPGKDYTAPSTQTETATTPTRPAPVTTPADRPADSRIVTIQNRLGENQSAEVVNLYLNGKKLSFKLDASRRSEQTYRLKVQPGNYSYRLESASVYQVPVRVWDGRRRRYVERRKNKTIYGSGSGQITLRGGESLTLYGKYDRDSGRMQLSVGAVGS